MSRVPGILLLYHRPVLRRDALTIDEHIAAFSRHSRYPVWNVNTDLGFPGGLRSLRFSVIVLHYSIFGQGNLYMLNRAFEAYLLDCQESRKIAFFQDEHRYCQKRFAFVNDYGIDTVYTLIDPDYWKLTYLKYSHARSLIHTLTGFVSEGLIEAARHFARPDAERTIDIGYRGRQLEYFGGRGSQEKLFIATEFLKRAAKYSFNVDISTEEKRRFYGDAWYQFLGHCRGSLGVEAGVSISDVEDKVRPLCESYLKDYPQATFQEVFDRILRPFEGSVPYRTISPRHFEAAAFRVCQILFEGNYNGLLTPMVHYLPLKKDFSNLDEIIRLFQDPEVRKSLTDKAYQDLIASGNYSYKRFIQAFDAPLLDLALVVDPALDRPLIQKKLRVNPIQWLWVLAKCVRRAGLIPKPIGRAYRKWKASSQV